jgi:adenine deaminase
MIGLLVVLLLACVPAAACSQERQYDIVITNGRIVDGTGSPWYAGSIGIRHGRIAAIGALPGPRQKGPSTPSRWWLPRAS